MQRLVAKLTSTGPSESTGLWCWHFDEWRLGRPDEAAPEGSDLAARRAQQAEVNGGDPFAHKTYPTPNEAGGTRRRGSVSVWMA